MVYPAGEDADGNYVRIDDTFTYENETRKPFDVISEYIRVQGNSAARSPPDAV